VTCTHLTCFLIKRIRVIAKSACSLRHVRVGAAYVYGSVNKIRFGLNRPKISDTLYEVLDTFYGCRRHKFAIKAFLRNIQSFVLLTVICSLTIHTEGIVSFSLQKWLREPAM
jgi:hypothetical protein